MAIFGQIQTFAIILTAIQYDYFSLQKSHYFMGGDSFMANSEQTKFDGLNDKHTSFIEKQKLFFVGTAAKEGRVNIALKGSDTLRVLGANRIVWLDLTGAENETAAHLLEIPRMTLMWCSFDSKPMILRAYGDAVSVHPRDEAWGELSALFAHIPGTRQVYDLNVDFVLKSCGFGVPLFGYLGERETLRKWAERKGEDGLTEAWEKNNQFSLDGKPTDLLHD